MATPPQRTFTLSVDVGSDPIAGNLADELGGRKEFIGWLGLARALETLLAPDQPPAWVSEEEKSGGGHS